MQVEKQYLISKEKFATLFILTFGLYGLWWKYKAWRFFDQKDHLEIMPAVRALFSVFFLISLFNRIRSYAYDSGIKRSFSSVGYYLGFFALTFTYKLPDPFWLLNVTAFIFLITPFDLLNDSIRNSEEINWQNQPEFNARQIILLAIGAIFWMFLIIALFLLF